MPEDHAAPEADVLSGPQLALLLHEAGMAERDSLAAALALADGQPPPRVGALVQHLSVSKRGCWETIGAALHLPAAPPELNLGGLCRWEAEQTAALTPAQLDTTLPLSSPPMTVAELLRLNIRHTAWIAGQIAAACSGPRLA